MKCGETIHVRDIFGASVLRCIAQCEGRFMLISFARDHLNGYLLPDWHGVLRELVTLAVPAKLTEKTMTAESTATGVYVNIPLTYPLSVKGLADLVGVFPDDVREQLEDLVVVTDG